MHNDAHAIKFDIAVAAKCGTQRSIVLVDESYEILSRNVSACDVEESRGSFAEQMRYAKVFALRDDNPKLSISDAYDPASGSVVPPG